MAYLVWKAELNTGIPVIDNQHIRIVEMINQLHDAVEAGNREGVGRVIEELVDYTISHFAFEEGLMEQAAYQFVGPHKKVHSLFIRRVAEFQDRYKQGEEVASELHSLLSTWLLSHIRRDDADYAGVVKESMNLVVADTTSGGWLNRAMKKFFGKST